MNMADHDTELDGLFAQARAARHVLPEALAVRIETDAEAVRLARLAPVPPSCRHRLRGIGGWQGLTGLVVASVTGVWIGFATPTFLPDPTEYFVSSQTSYLMADLNLDDDYLEDVE